MRVLRPCSLVSIAMLVAACATMSPRSHDRFDGKFVDQTEAVSAEADAFGRSRERRALSGQPHRESALDTFGGWSLIAAPEVKEYLNGITSRLLAQYPHETPHIEVFLTSNSIFDAYATPYQDIFVTLGLLQALDHEDELAFILAHESAHILLGHFRRDDWMAAQAKATKLAAQGAAIGVVLAESEVRTTDRGATLEVADQNAASVNVVRAAAAYFAAKEVAGTLFEPMWNRRQEDEADLLAMDLMIMAGYNATSALDTLTRLRGLEDHKAAQQKQRLARFQAERARAISAAAASGDTNATTQLVVATVAEGVVGLGKSLRDRAQSRHRMVEQREADLRVYYRREYRESTRLSDLKPLKRWTSKTEKILAHHVVAHEAVDALVNDDTDSAAALGVRSIAWPTSNAPFPRYVLYQVRKAQGRPRDALANLRVVQDSPEVSPVVLRSLAEEYLAAGQPGEALVVTNGAIARFDVREPFMPTRIAAYAAIGDEEDMQAELSACHDTGRRKLIERCKARVPDAVLTAGAN